MPIEILAIVLLSISTIYSANRLSATTARTSPVSSHLECKIDVPQTKWSKNENSLKVSIKIKSSDSVTLSVMPSFELRPTAKDSRDEDAYWAPFDLRSGNSTNLWQNLDLSHPDSIVSVSISPLKLKWGPAKSSVWPDKPWVEAVPPGKYELRAKIAIDKQNTIISNAETIEVSPK
jgi:hypothetical protein